MKILQLCLSDGVGGLELYMVRTTQAFDSQAIPIGAVVRPRTLIEQRLTVTSIPLYRLTPRCHRLPLITAWQLARLIDREAIDILHLHWGKDLLLAVLAKQFARRRVKLLYTRQMMLTRPKRDLYHRLLYRHLDRFLTITEQLRELAIRYLPLPAAAIQTLYYGVPQPPPLPPTVRQQWRQQFGCPTETTPLIGLVGRIEPNKGQHLLIEAIDQLRSAGVTAQATLIGAIRDPRYYQQLEQQIAQRGLSHLFTYYGTHPDPITLMAAFDLVVLTSEVETFGLVLIEAMRAGVAVVGSRAGGVPEIIEEGVSGLLFKPNCSADLAAQLQRLLTDPWLRQQLAATGERIATARFGVESHYRALLDHYRQLLA